MTGWPASAAIRGRGGEEERAAAPVEEEDSPPLPPGFDVPFAFLDFDPIEEWLVDPDPLSPMMPLRPPTEPGSDPPASPIDEKLQNVSLTPAAAEGAEVPSAVAEAEVKLGEQREAGTAEVVGSDPHGSDEESGDSGTEEDSETSTEDSGSGMEDSESSSSSDEGKEGDFDDDDDEGEEEEVEKKEEMKMEEDGDVEEGEIRELESEELAGLSDNDDGEAVRGPIKSMHELEHLPPVPPVQVSLEPHHETLPVGFISSILADRVIVDGSVKHNPLNEGSILWIADTRSPLGLVDEVFGPVKNPYYVVRYNSDKEVPAGIGQGTAISFAMEFASHILNEKDLYKKGYDASGENDEEVTDEVEFSDDEKEAEYRRSQRQMKRGTDDRRHQPPEHATDTRRFNSKGAGPRKGIRPPVPPAQTAMDKPQRSVSGSSHATSMTSTSGNRSYFFEPGHASNATPMAPEISGAAQVGGLNEPSYQMPQQHSNAVSQHGLPSQQHPNALLPFGLPPQQQPSGVFPYGFPPHQQPNAALLNGLTPQLQLNALWPSGLPLQQQLNVAWPAGLLPLNQPSAMWTPGFPLQQQQNVWMQGFPPQQQFMGLHGGYSNALQSHHQGNPTNVHHQNQVLNTYGTGMPCQQQLIPNLGAPTNVPCPGGPGTPSFGSTNPPASTGQGSFMQAPSMCNNITDQGVSGACNERSSMQQSKATVQSGTQSRPRFNMGRSPGRGRRPYVKGRHSFGRGDRARTG